MKRLHRCSQWQISLAILDASWQCADFVLLLVALEACAQSRDLLRTVAIHMALQHRGHIWCEARNAMLHAYDMCGALRRVEALVLDRLWVDCVVAVNSVLKALNEIDCYDRVITLFCDSLRVYRVLPSVTTLLAVIDSCARAQHMAVASQV